MCHVEKLFCTIGSVPAGRGAHGIHGARDHGPDGRHRPRFDGPFGTGAITTGAVGGSIGSAITFENGATFDELLQPVTFGGLLGFDVRFDVADSGTIGTGFGVALVNAALDDYVPGAGTGGRAPVRGGTDAGGAGPAAPGRHAAMN